MRRTGRNPKNRQMGFTIIEVLIVLAIIAIIAAIAIPLYRDSLIKAHIGALAGEARTLHTSFKQHFLDKNVYPNSDDNPAFNIATMEPLRSMGYYNGDITKRLMGGQADAFDSPDDLGVNQEFWLEMTLEIDPAVRVVVADSDDSPLGAGAWLDGVFVFRNGVLKPL